MSGAQEDDVEELPINLGGRPRKYSTPEEFDAKVNEYYQFCLSTGFKEPMTWTGLALFLGFYGRQEVDNYLKYEGFSDSVKRAKSLIEYGYEKRLHGNSPTGAIFALKNFNWKDKTAEEEAAESTPQRVEIVVKDARS